MPQADSVPGFDASPFSEDERSRDDVEGPRRHVRRKGSELSNSSVGRYSDVDGRQARCPPGETELTPLHGFFGL